MLSELSRDILCTSVKLLDCGAALERRAIEAALRLDRRSRIDRSEAAERRFDLCRGRRARHANVDDGARFVGDDIRSQPACHFDYIDRDSTIQILARR